MDDGVVSEQDYLASSPSIVVILKEVNDPDSGGWDLRQFLRDGGRPQTWDNVVRWVHGIRNRGQVDDWPNQYEEISEWFRVEILRSICAINLKKSPGTHTAEMASLARIANEDAVRIQEQYAIYDPDLTICGGTGELFRTVPEARVQDSLLHYGLIDAVNELLA